MSFFVYLLVCTDGSTYIGATVNLDHRLRQHNKEIKGGAVQTSKKVLKGETWSRECYVSGFPSWRTALQFEWRWKQLTRKMFAGRFFNVNRRKIALDVLLALPKATANSIPYSEWETPLQVHLAMQSIQNNVKIE
jgi:structure-specific endonuclease subunit SLX1